MKRVCTSQDLERIYFIINDAAKAYKGRIPDNCYHEPYMPWEELVAEAARMTFLGWEEDGQLVGVMGQEVVHDVTLIRHAYVLTAYQRRGIGAALLGHLRGFTRTPWLLVGTWADAWSIDFYLKHGFQLMPNKDELLLAYWDVPARQRETSVVLGKEIG
ncbi:MAG TPA: GNAT family N-acetyltransferase [Dehalococcoidia bacterium]|nr:GNAT family N-acetyltransferase [Dehalococcoidia bacterium]